MTKLNQWKMPELRRVSLAANGRALRSVGYLESRTLNQGTEARLTQNPLLVVVG